MSHIHEFFIFTFTPVQLTGHLCCPLFQICASMGNAHGQGFPLVEATNILMKTIITSVEFSNVVSFLVMISFSFASSSQTMQSFTYLFAGCSQEV